MKKNEVLLLGGLGLLAYLVVTGKIRIPGKSTGFMQPVTSAGIPIANPNWPKDPQGNPLTPGTIIDPTVDALGNPVAPYPNGGVVNASGYVV